MGASSVGADLPLSEVAGALARLFSAEPNSLEH